MSQELGQDLNLQYLLSTTYLWKGSFTSCGKLFHLDHLALPLPRIMKSIIARTFESHALVGNKVAQSVFQLYAVASLARQADTNGSSEPERRLSLHIIKIKRVHNITMILMLVAAIGTSYSVHSEHNKQSLN